MDNRAPERLQCDHAATQLRMPINARNSSTEMPFQTLVMKCVARRGRWLRSVILAEVTDGFRPVACALVHTPTQRSRGCRKPGVTSDASSNTQRSGTRDLVSKGCPEVVSPSDLHRVGLAATLHESSIVPVFRDTTGRALRPGGRAVGMSVSPFARHDPSTIHFGRAPNTQNQNRTSD